jgi:L-arabinose isomerase
VWKPRPNLPVAAGVWILAGGSHHPVFSQALNAGHFECLAEMWGIELVAIR